MITILAALAGHDKTWWLMIAIIKALLTGEPLFGYFKVIEKATRVIYLCPEVAVGAAFYRFCTKMKLDEFIKGRPAADCYSVDWQENNTHRFGALEKVPGADLFLDTLPRFRCARREKNPAPLMAKANCLPFSFLIYRPPKPQIDLCSTA